MSLSPSYSFRLIILIVCIFLSVLIIAGVSLSVIEEHLLKRSGQSLSLSAINIAEEISHFLDERYQSLKVLTQVPIPQNSKAGDLWHVFLKTIHKEEPQFQRLSLVNSSGEVLASTDSSLTGTVIKDMAIVDNAALLDTVFVRNVYSQEESEGIMLKIFTPIASPRDSGAESILVADLKVSFLESIFLQAQQHIQQQRENPIHVEWQLLRPDGHILIDSVLREEGKVSLLALELPSAGLVFQGAPGFVEEVHRRRNVPVLTGFSQLPANKLGQKWGVLVRMDQSEVLPAIHYTLTKIGGGLSLMLFPLLGLLVWLTLRLNREHARTLHVETQYRQIFERNLEGIYRRMLSGKLELVNPAMAKMFGYQEPAAMVEAFSRQQQDPHVDPDRRAAFMQQLMVEGEVHGFESEIQTCQGERRWISETAYLVTERSGAPQYIEGTVEDITERRKAEVALQQAQDQLLEQQRDETMHVTRELEKVRQNLIRQTQLAALGQLSASIAHELRNPLGAIRNVVFLLKRKLSTDNEKIQHYLAMMEEDIEQSDQIIRDLLSMARGKLPVKGMVSLGEVLENVWSHTPFHGQSRLVLDLVPQPFFLWCDQNQLQQVFRNLMENSVQAMHDLPGRVTVTARHDETMDVVTIHDTGEGIAMTDREQIFEPLFSHRVNGHGLGLTICRQIVESHGGTIRLTEGEIPGTTFLLKFPQKIVQRDA